MNICVLSGNVSEIQYAVTEVHGDEAASFTLFVADDSERTTLARVNVFGSLVRLCRLVNLERGDYVLVEGRLMNRTLRSTKAMALEIKAKDLKVIANKKSNMSINRIHKEGVVE